MVTNVHSRVACRPRQNLKEGMHHSSLLTMWRSAEQVSGQAGEAFQSSVSVK
jgi:hypothetical protein